MTGRVVRAALCLAVLGVMAPCAAPEQPLGAPALRRCRAVSFRREYGAEAGGGGVRLRGGGAEAGVGAGGAAPGWEIGGGRRDNVVRVGGQPQGILEDDEDDSHGAERGGADDSGGFGSNLDLPWDDQDEPTSDEENESGRSSEEDERSLEPHQPWQRCFEVFTDGLDPLEELRTRPGISPQDVALWEATEKGDLEGVEAALAQGGSVNVTGGSMGSMPVLHAAAALGFPTIVARLIEKGAGLEERDGEGWTALQLAADCGEDECVKRLHAAGADVNAQVVLVNGSSSWSIAKDQVLYEYAETALHWATQNKQPEVGARMVDLLADLGADLERTTTAGRTPLHWAVDINNVPCAEALAKRGANLNAKTKDKFTPLTFSARAGREAMTVALLAAGADTQCRGENMRTPLYWAEQNSHDVIADHIRKHGIVDRAPIPQMVWTPDSEDASSQEEGALSSDASSTGTGEDEARAPSASASGNGHGTN